MAATEVQQYKVFAQKYYDPINDPDKQGTGMLALNPDDTDAWWEGHRQQLPCLYAVYQHVTGAVVSSGQIERDFGVCGDGLPAKRNTTAPQFFQAQVFARVSAICVGAPVDREEQDVQEENMEVEGEEEVDEIGESDAVGSGGEEIHDLTTSSTHVGGGAGGGRRRTASSRVSGEEWGQ